MTMIVSAEKIKKTWAALTETETESVSRSFKPLRRFLKIYTHAFKGESLRNRIDFLGFFSFFK